MSNAYDSGLPDVSGPDDETRGYPAMSRESLDPSAGDETRELATPAMLDSVPSASRSGSVTDLQSDDGSAPPPEPSDSRVGQRIGRFIVLSTLGRGGMGTVYEVFDRTLDRRVAVKVLHQDMNRDHQQRLIREAQALAQLSHPNVVQVYEVGEVDGQSFVAMELVQGQTLRQWIRQQPRPDWRSCVELYLQAGAGLAAAHAQGLVHCDFKPANAIVDDSGRVRVLDFGLAREADSDPALNGGPGSGPGSESSGKLDSSTLVSDLRSARRSLRGSLTETGAVMGTPAYMPPEQMRRREVDASGDQYSFCVSLYEALYDQRPFPGKTMAELRVAREDEEFVTPPRNTKVPAVLLSMLQQGMRADPNQRWPSMQALLDELRPLATPKRRRTLIAISGALAAGLAVAGAGLAYQADMGQRCSGAQDQLDGIWDNTQRQQVEDAILGTEFSYAPDTWERVSVQLDRYAEGWVDKHTEVCEATSVRQEQSTGVMDLRMSCLRERKVALRETVKVLTKADTTRLAQAVTLVQSLPDLARCDDVETLRAELPPPEDPQVAEQVEALRDRMAQVRALRNAGDYDQALAEIENVWEQADGLGHAPLQAETLLELGVARREKAQYEQAEQALERAYLLAAQLEHFSVEAAAVRELAFVVGYDQAKHDDGLQWAKTALALAQGPRARPRDEAAVLSMIGATLLKKGELNEALVNHERAVALFEQALGPGHSDIAEPLHAMGNALWRQGKLDEALTHLRRARTIREEALGAGHPHIAHSLTTIGAVLIQKGERELALAHLQQALELREAALGSEHPDVATSLNNIGAILKQQGQRQEALDNFRRALAIQSKALGPRHPRVAYPLNNIGEVLREQGKLDEALEYLERALAITEDALGPNHPDVASSVTNVGNLLFRQERYDEARSQFQRALTIQTEALPADHPHVAWSLLGLAKVDIRKNNGKEARKHAERAVTIREAQKMPTELIAEARFVLARALWSDPSQRSRARQLAEQARDGWSTGDAGDDHTKEYLDDVEKWLGEHTVD